MNSLPSAPVAAQEKYRIEAGTGPRCVVGQVDVSNGIIVAAPPIWRKFEGQKMHRLEWWLTRVYGTSQTRRMGV